MTFVRPLNEERRSELQSWVTRAEADVSLAREWVTNRGLVYETCRRFKLGVVTSDHPSSEFRRYDGRLVIPGLGPNGVYSVRFRDMSGHSEQKMLGLPNTPVRPYNVQALHYAGDFIAITEGEMDALTLEQCGIPAVGFTGVSSWQKWSHRLFEGFQTVYVVADNDEPGITFANKVAKVVPQARIIVPGSDGDDCNSFYVDNGGWSGDGRSALYDLLGLTEPEMAVAV